MVGARHRAAAAQRAGCAHHPAHQLPGGDVQEGLRLPTLSGATRGRKIAVIEGVCASAATFPACACDELHMHAESLLMIHSPVGRHGRRCERARVLADVLKKMSDLMVGMYQRKTGADEETVRGWMSKETWMKPQEAKDAGFCDLIISADEPFPRVPGVASPPWSPSSSCPLFTKKRSPMAMKDELRAKLALHGLAEDGGNMDEDTAATCRRREDVQGHGQGHGREVRPTKAEDDKKKEGDEGASHEEPDGDEPKAAIKAPAQAGRAGREARHDVARAHRHQKGSSPLLTRNQGAAELT